jgi:predicted aspartyl protease
MPAIEIALGAPEAGCSLGPLLAILDTGADITMVPKTYLAQLRAPVVSAGYLRSPWGERQPVKIYELDVCIAGRLLPQVEVVADPQARDVLLGRDVLNTLNMQLDGPAKTVTVVA